MADQKRPVGRPRVHAIPVNVRLRPEELHDLDRWIDESGVALSRAEGIRRLIKKGQHAP